MVRKESRISLVSPPNIYAAVQLMDLGSERLENQYLIGNCEGSDVVEEGNLISRMKVVGATDTKY